MLDYLKRFMIALLMAVCISLLFIGGGAAHSNAKKNESFQPKEVPINVGTSFLF
ncbi:hypothetical protein JOC78_000969 [Bacillus ectoiniformans]|uniref:hypothetical protein n=1 Tax=Bacillus ectoiniformans TaxID=1494429 RepID=UPI00195EEE0E|nr:hypothetical protein [Bacillus ectoiniformans]MBM7648029.1 hypothetical protein [Bacillus ectoiniformans]